MTELAAAVPDCRDCGACCHGDEAWIRLRRGDEERLGDVARWLVVRTALGRGSRVVSVAMPGGRCAAFRDALPDGAGSGCSVYSVRPAICRELEAGSPGCLEARARRGLS